MNLKLPVLDEFSHGQAVHPGGDLDSPAFCPGAVCHAAQFPGVMGDVELTGFILIDGIGEGSTAWPYLAARLGNGFHIESSFQCKIRLLLGKAIDFHTVDAEGVRIEGIGSGFILAVGVKSQATDTLARQKVKDFVFSPAVGVSRDSGAVNRSVGQLETDREKGQSKA